MKKVLLGTVALIALAAPASAADIAARPYTKAPPPPIAAVYDWTGFYIGANGGWGSSHKCWDSVAPALLGTEGCHDATGGVAGGQIGYAANNVLFYVKGGAAVTADRFRIRDTASGFVVGTTGDDTRWGGTVGAGLEFGFAPNWSAAIEYDHLFMQDRTVTFTAPATGLFFGSDRIRQDVDLVTVRVNYRWGGPVIGKY